MTSSSLFFVGIVFVTFFALVPALLIRDLSRGLASELAPSLPGVGGKVQPKSRREHLMMFYSVLMINTRF
jgi:hypothetical protein